VTASDTNLYARIKAYEEQAYTRLNGYLQALDPAGWTEQSYCSDWAVYQVVSHIGSGSQIGGLRVKAWTSGGAPVSREVMQGIWGRFDALGPQDMLPAYLEAAQGYLAVESETPDAAGEQEVDGFAGKRPLSAYQLSRTWELGCHSWDVYVSRDRNARLDPAAVALLAEHLHFINLPLDKERAAQLGKATFKLTGSGLEYSLDPTAERPRATQGGSADAPLAIEGPDEEVVRFLSGRGYVPGAVSQLKVTRGSGDDLAKLRRAFR
jgi:uncharacterized protein (TIGR03083 family)